MKYLIASLMTILLAVFVACGSGQEQETTPEDETAAEGETTTTDTSAQENLVDEALGDIGSDESEEGAEEAP